MNRNAAHGVTVCDIGSSCGPTASPLLSYGSQVFVFRIQDLLSPSWWS